MVVGVYSCVVVGVWVVMCVGLLEGLGAVWVVGALVGGVRVDGVLWSGGWRWVGGGWCLGGV